MEPMCNSICARRFTARQQSVTLVANRTPRQAQHFGRLEGLLGEFHVELYLTLAPKGARQKGVFSLLVVNSTQALVDTNNNCP
jgi:hypothetical protein